MPQFLKQYGEQLVALGYTVLPIRPGTKRPDLKNWPNHNTTAEDVVAWYSNGRANHGAGVNARNTPAIDVDVLDTDVAQQMSDEIDAIFGAGLWTRTGLYPKFLVPFRSDAPFRKMTSAIYTDGENEHKVEILGDGQQWVAYHIHPDTEQPYQWFDGFTDDGIRSVARSALPELDASHARLVIDAFERIASGLVAQGKWRVAANVQVEPRSGDHLGSDDPFAGHAEPVTDLTPAQIGWLLEKLPLADRDGWLRAGRILHHQYDASEEGFDFWTALSESHEKYDADDQRRVWESFGHRDGAPETVRSLMKDFGQPPAAEHKPRADGSANPFAVHEWSSYKQNYLSTPWIIKGVLPQAEVGILYGQSGSGKTFFVLDMAACVARGAEWRGRKVSNCRVVYVAAEAREGIKKRMDAYDQHVCADGSRPDIIASAPNLLSTDTKQLIEAIGSAGLIILDTMAASHSGDENSAKDMGLFLAACKDISHATGAMVLAVHHTGKEDSKGMRGSSALFAGADFVMEIFKNKVGDRFEHGAMLSKSRDDVTGTSFGFELKRVTVGVDDEGDDVTTCVIEAVQKEVSKTPKRPRKLANLEDSRYDMHREILTIFERITDESPTKVVTDDQLLDAIVKKFPSKLRRNMVPLVLRLEEFGVIRRTEAGLNLADDDLDAC
jgi:hypothetical protein